jgi:indolepyruvate ferredoxin oxidoreductase
VELGRRHLSDYQNDKYAQRFVDLVRRMANVEARNTQGSDLLAIAVARNYRKLLAYKDEYEVARLYSRPEYRKALNDSFEFDGRVSILLAPPLLGGPRDSNGNPRKREFGPWIFSVFGVLARMKGLRGTALDIFGHTQERAMERALITEYEAWLDEIAAGLSPECHDLAVEIAMIPDQIRGYGQVKLKSVQSVRERAARLLERFREAQKDASKVATPAVVSSEAGHLG